MEYMSNAIKSRAGPGLYTAVKQRGTPDDSSTRAFELLREMDGEGVEGRGSGVHQAGELLTTKRCPNYLGMISMPTVGIDGATNCVVTISAL